MKERSMIYGFRSSTSQIIVTSVMVVASIGASFMVRFGQKHSERVYDLAFSPDGKSVASAGDDGVVMVWDASTGIGRTQPGQSVAVFSVSWSPDGKTLATETWDGNRGVIELRDSVSGALRATVWEHSDQRHTLRFSPDGGLLALAGHEAMIWDVAAARPRFKLKGFAHCLAFSPDGKTLASGAETITLWDVVKREERATLKGYKGAVESLSFSPDGKFLASASNDLAPSLMRNTREDVHGEVKIWDVSSGLVKSEFLGTSRVRAITFAPNGVTLAVGEANGAVQVWSTATHGFLRPIRVNRAGVTALAFSPDGKILAAGGEDGAVHMLRFTQEIK